MAQPDNERQDCAMSQESAKEPEKKFFEKFKKAADAQDLEAVFVMVKEVDDFFQVSGWKSSHAFAVRKFVRQNLREVLLCWYEKIRELYSCNPPEYDKIVELHRQLLVAYPSAEKAKSLVGYLSNYRVFQRKQKQGDILLMLAKAYFLKEDKEPEKAKDFLAVLLSDKYGVPDDIVAQAALLRVDVYLAERFKEEALIFLKRRIRRYEKEERLELARALKNRLNAISPDSPPNAGEKRKPARLVISGDIRRKGTVMFDGQRVGKPFDSSKRAFQLFATVAYLRATEPVQGGFEGSEIMGRLRGISPQRRKVSRIKKAPGYVMEMTQKQDVSPIRKAAEYIETTPALREIWRRDKKTGRCDINLPPEQIDVSHLVIPWG